MFLVIMSVCLYAWFVVIFGIYASETFPLLSKVTMDRLVLETEGAVSRDLAELFRQVHSSCTHLFCLADAQCNTGTNAHISDAYMCYGHISSTGSHVLTSVVVDLEEIPYSNLQVLVFVLGSQSPP